MDPLLDTPDDGIDEVGVQLLLTWFFEDNDPDELQLERPRPLRDWRQDGLADAA